MSNSPEYKEDTVTFTLNRFCMYCGVFVEQQIRTWPRLDFERASKFGDPTIDKSAYCEEHRNNPPQK